MSRSSKSLRFEDAMKRLDAIVEAMEKGEIGLEESITRYEEAMRLAAQCRAILHDAEQRIRRIQLDAQGRPQAVPLDQPPAPEAPSAEDET